MFEATTGESLGQASDIGHADHLWLDEKDAIGVVLPYPLRNAFIKRPDLCDLVPKRLVEQVIADHSRVVCKCLCSSQSPFVKPLQELEPSICDVLAGLHGKKRNAVQH